MQNKIIDFHTHAFSDDFAARAMQSLTKDHPDVPYFLDGTVGSLLKSMDNAGIDKSVICSIATKPKQFKTILDWSLQIQSDRIIPLGSVHPSDPERDEHISQIAKAGLKGIKMHPYYQDFYLDEDTMYKFYEQVIKNNLFLVMHTGFDVAFEFIDRAGPSKVLKVLNKFRELKLITTHFGAWQQWDKVADEIIGKNIYMEISFALDYLDPATAKKLLEKHPSDYILFGSDSPWRKQDETLNLLGRLNLEPSRMEKILCKNAQRLLNV
jgi:predicted TIM-barrel fold metal-dependent hydrolase